jgi:FtsH-binding integral membrane protein
MGLSATARPIEGAVATLGVSDRVAFLRKTYLLLGVALIAFAGFTGGMITYLPEASFKFSAWAFSGYAWLLVLALFMVVGWVSQKLATSQTSRGLQYLGLGLTVGAWTLLLQPMLWVLMIRFADKGMYIDPSHPALSHTAGAILGEAVVITLSIFVGLTLTVFLTKKDFSFMRGALAIATFAALGVILASILFGFHLGAIFSGLMILLMAGYILYQTSLVMKAFPPTAHVAAALMLFSTVATLFWYVLRLLMEMNRR